MQPCLWTDMLPYMHPEEAVTTIGKAGFQFVEFGLTHERTYFEDVSSNEPEEARLDRLRETAENAGVQIVQMHGRLFNLCGRDVEDHIAAAHRSLRRAARLGVKWVVLHPGSARDVAADPDLLRWTRERNVEVFTEFLTTAEEVGVGIAIENMIGGKGHPFGAAVDDLLWLVDKLDSPRVGICWDTGHAELSGIDQGRALRAVGDHLVALHIADNDGQGDRHWCPGRGIVNWAEVMDALRDIKYQGPFNLEVPGELRVTPRSAMEAKLKYLAALSKAMIAGDTPG